MPRWGGWLRQISASWGGSVLRNGRSSYTALLPGGRVAGRWGETWGWFQTVRQLTNYAISLRLKASREQRIAGPITFSLWGAMLTLVPRRGHVNSRENMATAEYRRAMAPSIVKKSLALQRIGTQLRFSVPYSLWPKYDPTISAPRQTSGNSLDPILGALLMRPVVLGDFDAEFDGRSVPPSSGGVPTNTGLVPTEPCFPGSWYTTR